MSLVNFYRGSGTPSVMDTDSIYLTNEGQLYFNNNLVGLNNNVNNCNITRGFYVTSVDSTNNRIYVTSQKTDNYGTTTGSVNVLEYWKNDDDTPIDFSSPSGDSTSNDGYWLSATMSNNYVRFSKIVGVGEDDGMPYIQVESIPFNTEDLQAIDPTITQEDVCFIFCDHTSLVAKGPVTLPLNKCVTLGTSCYANMSHSFAQGRHCKAIGKFSTAVGSYTVAGWAASAEGRSCHALGLSSHAEGKIATATGEAAHARNHMTTAAGFASSAIGSCAVAQGSASLAGGYDTQADGNYSVAMGFRSATTSAAESSFAFGRGLTACASDQVVFGRYNTNNNSALLIVGNGVSNSQGVTLNNAFVVHSDGRATVGKAPTGNMDVVNKSYLDTWSPVHKGTGSNSIIAGDDTSATNVSTFACGTSTIASGKRAFASGAHTQATGVASTAMGVGTIANQTGQLVVGNYNAAASSSVFIVGNGSGSGKTDITDSNRSNALVVYNSGLVQISKTLHATDIVATNSLSAGNVECSELYTGGGITSDWITCSGSVSGSDIAASMSVQIANQHMLSDNGSGYLQIDSPKVETTGGIYAGSDIETYGDAYIYGGQVYVGDYDNPKVSIDCSTGVGKVGCDELHIGDGKYKIATDEVELPCLTVEGNISTNVTVHPTLIRVPMTLTYTVDGVSGTDADVWEDILVHTPDGFSNHTFTHYVLRKNFSVIITVSGWRNDSTGMWECIPEVVYATIKEENSGFISWGEDTSYSFNIVSRDNEIQELYKYIVVNA